MPWLQVKLEISPSIAEPFEDLLLASGALSVTYQDTQDTPIYEPELGTTPLWSQTTITGLFEADNDMKAVEHYLQQGFETLDPTTSFPKLHIEILEDKDWEREWMKSYQPMQFGERLWVCPTWCEPPNPDAVNLMLDPGLAFGTGTHPTTALCLSWLDGLELNDKSVTDYGCGSGILGVAALLLGAKTVLAIDIDEQALKATNTNLERNQLASNRLQCFLPEDAPHERSEILVANILSGPLVELAPAIASRVETGGKLALSGLLANQQQSIVDTYSEWFELDPCQEKEGWIRVTGTRK